MSADLHLLTHLVTLNCSNAGLTGTLDLHGITTLTTVDCSNNASLIGLIPTGCTALVSLDANSCDITGPLDLSSLPATIDHVALDTNIHLTSVDLSNIVTINGGGGIGLSFCAALTSVTATDLNYNAGLFNVQFCTNLSSLSFPALIGMDGDLIFNNSGVVTVSAPFCTKVHSLDGSNCPSLTTVSMSALDNNLGDMNFYDSVSLLSLTLNSLTQNSNLDVHGCTSLVSLSLTNGGLNLAGTIDAHGCTNLSNVAFTVTSGPSSNPFVCNFNNCALNLSSVDGVLSAYNAQGSTMAVIDLSAGTNSAPTGGVLNADYVALVTAGNTVTINP